MKKILKISVSLSLLLVLISCPGGNFIAYHYAGNNSSSIIDIKAESKIIDENIGSFKCGYLMQCINEKSHRLLVSTKSKDMKIVSVESNKLGFFEKYENDEYLAYFKDFQKRNSDKNLRQIKDDTITVRFEKCLEYYFVNK